MGPRLAAVLLSWLVAASALADTKASVLGLEARDAPADIVQQMTLALRLALADAPGYQAVPGKDLVEMRLIFCSGSEEPQCMASVAKSLGVAELIYGVVTGTAKGFTVSMNLLDAESETIKAKAEEPLPLAVAPQDVDTAAARLLGILIGLPIPSLLRVICEPAGGRLTIDGIDIGHVGELGRTVPDVAPGPRSVRVTLDGYVPFEQIVQIKSGEANELHVQLSPESRVVVKEDASPGASPSASARVWRIVSWVSMGTALAAGGAAVVTALKTRALEEDKREAVEDSRIGLTSTEPGYINAGPGDDACAEAKLESAGRVSDLCSRGRRMATVTNVLLGTAGAAALMWGISFHAGYLRVEAEPSGAVVVAAASF